MTSMRALSELRMERGTEPGASALFSDDGAYRYVLERNVRAPLALGDHPHRFVACGLNPSTADAFKLDPTCKRETALARAHGCGIYVKVNAYAWRDKEPAKMFAAARGGADIVGPSNYLAIRMALTQLKRDGGIALACWGANAEPERILPLLRIAREVGIQWVSLGENRNGSPKHPLYLPSSTQLRPWPAPRESESAVCRGSSGD